MIQDDKFTITLKIAGVEFKPKILRSEEEYYRRAADDINKAYRAYLERYKTADRDRILLALALQFAITYNKGVKELEEVLHFLEEENLGLTEFFKNE